jgi:hypothetical protein
MGMATSYCFQHFPHYKFVDLAQALLASNLFDIEFAHGDKLMLRVKGVVLLAVARTGFIIEQVIEFAVRTNMVCHFVLSWMLPRYIAYTDIHLDRNALNHNASTPC